jgi:hypothetical protein
VDESVAILARHVQQLSDHQRRQQMRELAHQLDLALGVEVVDQLVGELLDARPHLFHDAGRERFVEQPPQPQMLLAVQGGKPELHDLLEVVQVVAIFLGELPREDIGAHRGQARIAQQGHHVVVVGHQPRAARKIDPVEPSAGEHLLVRRVRIGDKVGVEHWILSCAGSATARWLRAA